MANFLHNFKIFLSSQRVNWIKTARCSLEQRVVVAWHRPPFWGLFLLFPLTYLYRFIFWLKKSNDLRKWPSYPCPIIVVGNLTVGGTGKTPVVIWLVNYLQQQGYKPGVISRGYGGEPQATPRLVLFDSDPAQVGDEPIVIARRTQAPVVVGVKRNLSIQFLLSMTDINIIVSDDGLQHYAMPRDIEILVIDGKRRFGNGYCLPLGPLREPLSRYNAIPLRLTQCNPRPGELGLQVICPDAVISITSLMRTPLSNFISTQVHAVAGIGHPEKFFKQLEQAGLSIIRHPFPDHHQFQSQDLDFGDQLPIIMTEKDAVKCMGFAAPHHYYLPIDVVPDQDFSRQLMELLK